MTIPYCRSFWHWMRLSYPRRQTIAEVVFCALFTRIDCHVSLFSVSSKKDQNTGLFHSVVPLWRVAVSATSSSEK